MCPSSCMDTCVSFEQSKLLISLTVAVSFMAIWPKVPFPIGVVGRTQPTKCSLSQNVIS